jgi:hypothetical protein
MWIENAGELLARKIFKRCVNKIKKGYVACFYHYGKGWTILKVADNSGAVYGGV